MTLESRNNMSGKLDVTQEHMHNMHNMPIDDWSSHRTEHLLFPIHVFDLLLAHHSHLLSLDHDLVHPVHHFQHSTPHSIHVLLERTVRYRALNTEKGQK